MMFGSQWARGSQRKTPTDKDKWSGGFSRLGNWPVLGVGWGPWSHLSGEGDRGLHSRRHLHKRTQRLQGKIGEEKIDRYPICKEGGGHFMAASALVYISRPPRRNRVILIGDGIVEYAIQWCNRALKERVLGSA